MPINGLPDPFDERRDDQRWPRARPGHGLVDPTDFRGMPFKTVGGPVTSARPAIRSMQCDRCFRWVEPGTLMASDVSALSVKFHHYPQCPALPGEVKEEAAMTAPAIKLSDGSTYEGPTNVRGALLTLMRERASGDRTQRKGWVGMDTVQMSREVSTRVGHAVPPAAITATLHHLRDDQMVGFETSKSVANAVRRGSTSSTHGNPKNGIPVRIRLTPKGMRGPIDDNELLPGPAMETVERPSDVLLGQEAQAVGIAVTPEVTEAIERWDAEHPILPAADARLIADVNAEANVPTLGDKYPLIRQLVEAESNLLEASRLLRKAGRDTLADMALEDVERTPLEAEVVALVKELGLMGVVDL